MSPVLKKMVCPPTPLSQHSRCGVGAPMVDEICEEWLYFRLEQQKYYVNGHTSENIRGLLVQSVILVSFRR